jgi:hypothetical protein
MNSFMDIIERFPYYFRLFLFFLYHFYCKVTKKLYNNLIQPIDNWLDQFRPKEPEESEWIQLYCLTTNISMSDFGWPMWSYQSYTKVLYSHVESFVAFAKHQYDLLLDYPTVILPYDYEFEKQAMSIETLFIVKNNGEYVVRTYTKKKPQQLIVWDPYPKRSDMNFLFVEYRHHEMRESIELKIPDGYYLEGNELFSPAFIKRCLEYSKCYYVFDMDYEIHFMDHEMKEGILNSKEYVLIQEDGYDVRKSMIDNEEVIYTTKSNSKEEERDEDENTKKYRTLSLDFPEEDTEEEGEGGEEGEGEEEEKTVDERSLDDSSISDYSSFWWPF